MNNIIIQNKRIGHSQYHHTTIPVYPLRLQLSSKTASSICFKCSRKYSIRPTSFISPASDQPFSVIKTSGLSYSSFTHLKCYDLLSRMQYTIRTRTRYLNKSPKPLGTENSQDDFDFFHSGLMMYFNLVSW